MIHPAANLSSDDLRAEIARLQKGRSVPIVVFGHAVEADFDVEISGEFVHWQIKSAASELELREVLSAQDSAALAVAIDFAADLPLDILTRIVANRVHIPDRSGRLIRLLCPASGVKLEASAELLASGIAKALLAGAPANAISPTGATLGLDHAWRAFLSANAGLPPESPLTLDRLLEFVATAPLRPGLAAVWTRFQDLRGQFEVWLKASAGAPALQAWQAWEEGRGLQVAAVAVLVQAIVAGQLGDDEFLRGWLAAPLADARLHSISAADQRVWAEGAATMLHRSRGTPLFLRVVEAADAQNRSAEAQRRLGLVSRFLPSAFAYQQAELASVIDHIRTTKDRGRFDAATTLLRQLRNHWMADRDTHSERLGRAHFALRLLGWWLSAVPIPNAPAHLQAPVWAAWYAQDGGFIDLARRQLRAGGNTLLDQAVARLVADVDARRDVLDAQFGEAAAAWQRAGRPLAEAMPIEMALDVLAVNFLKGHKDRKLLVLVLDGAPWSVVVELLLDMQSRDWAPLRWRPQQFAHANAMAVLADLPTLTDVSRAALFQGSRIAAGAKLPTSKDVERFAQHPGLCTVMTKAAGPRLLLKGHLMAADGSLSPLAGSLLRSSDVVVGCVVNAIDDDLGGALQVRSQYTVDEVPLLRQLLDAAFAAGRAVLLIADHGYAPGDRMAYEPNAAVDGAGGARWHALAAGEAVAAGEVVLPKSVVWAPPGYDRIAMLTQDTKRYSRTASAGEHGGISLAEMVAPAVLLGDSELEGRAASSADQDPGVKLQPPFVPGWWRLELDGPPLNGPPAGKGSKHRTKPVPIITLPFDAADKAGLGLARPVPTRSALVTQVAQSEVLNALPAHQRKTLHDKVLPWLELIIAAGGRMSTDRFAQAAGLLPSRVPGAISTMGELLGLDGYQPVAYDGVANQVSVQEDTLRQLFVDG